MTDSTGRLRLTQEQIRAIETVLNSGCRAELIPIKDNIRIIRERRDEIKV